MKKRGDSGFALLLVLLMAGIIAITLYMQIPRVAFEAQRQKEQLLIERGEQYQRAIELFFRENKRYPARIEDLESFNNRRFLRHKFKDPMTGKDEWRLIHINSAGVLSDSLLNKGKPGDAKQESTTAGQYVGEQAAIGAVLTPAQGGAANAANRRRASEGGANPGTIGPDGQPISGGVIQQTTGIAPYPNPQQFPGAQPVNPGQPQQYMPGQQPYPGAVGNVAANPGAPVPAEIANIPQAAGNPASPAYPGQPSQVRYGATPYPIPGLPIPGQPIPGQPGQQAPNSQANAGYVGGNQPYVGGSQPYVGGGYVGAQPVGGAVPAPGQVNPGAPGFQPNYPTGGVQPILGQGQTPLFPAQGAGAQNPATQMIQQILTNPRPAPTGAAPGQAAGQPIGQQIGGGIAGVASKAEDPSIMVYKDRTKYNEWEFVFDFSKPKGAVALAGQGQGVVGTPAQTLGSTPGTAASGTNPGNFGAGSLGNTQSNSGANFGPGSLGNTTAAPGGTSPNPNSGQNPPFQQQLPIQMPPTTDPTLRMGQP